MRDLWGEKYLTMDKGEMERIQLEKLRKQVTKSEMDFEQTLSKPEEETSTTTKEEEDDNKHDKLLELIQKIGRTTIDESEWEIEVIPPMEKTKIVGFATNLNTIPEVEKTEVIPRANKSVIAVSLNKPARLTEEEFQVVKTHPQRGCAVLEPIPQLSEVMA